MLFISISKFPDRASLVRNLATSPLNLSPTTSPDDMCRPHLSCSAFCRIAMSDLDIARNHCFPNMIHCQQFFNSIGFFRQGGMEGGWGVGGTPPAFRNGFVTPLGSYWKAPNNDWSSFPKISRFMLRLSFFFDGRNDGTESVGSQFTPSECHCFFR